MFKVAPGQPLTPIQETGLELVAHLEDGRDVVLAVDLTESVGLNDQGRSHLRQLVTDSLSPGDQVYVVPFATKVQLPIQPIQFRGTQDVEAVLQAIPQRSDTNLANTDIQCAELSIYQFVAQLNQNRLQANQPIYPQSIVWLTDAPLETQPGEAWTESPASPCGKLTTPQGQERQTWLQTLPRDSRFIQPGTFKLTVVDIAPTAQELCTPIPGGEQTCLINPYLLRQLWLPGLGALVLALVGLGAAAVGLKRWLNAQKSWKLTIETDSGSDYEDNQVVYLPINKQIAIGEYEAGCVDAIDCPGSDVRAYLKRRGSQLELIPTGGVPIYWQEREVTRRTRLSGSLIKLNCPDLNNQDFYVVIQLAK